jgi:DNA mismatch repair ATPase MutS
LSIYISLDKYIERSILTDMITDAQKRAYKKWSLTPKGKKAKVRNQGKYIQRLKEGSHLLKELVDALEKNGDSEKYAKVLKKINKINKK